MKIFSAQLKGTTTVATGSNVSLTGSFSGSIAGIDLNSNNNFTSSINTFTSSVINTNTFTSSTSARLNSIEAISASNLNRIGSLETISASNVARINSLETHSASVDTTNSTQNGRLTSLENKSGSLATTGSNTFIGTQVFTGSVYITSDLIVQGSSSIQNITGSSINIGTNTIVLNTANPAVRYAGISAIDSGSSGLTGSIVWDSTNNNWLYVNPSGSSYASAKFIAGPKSATLGSELGLVTNYIQKAVGDDHISSSAIYDDGNTIALKSNTEITGSLKVTSNVGIGTTSAYPLAIYASSTQTSIALLSGYSNSNARNWGLASNALAYGDLNLMQSTSQGGEPFSAGTSRIYINPSGNIGIGTTNPSSTLHIFNGINANISSNNAVAIFDGGSGTKNSYIIIASNWLGTGTRPESELQFWNNSYGGSSANSVSLKTISSQGNGSGQINGSLAFVVANNTTSPTTEAMRITSSGSIGIGTTTPTAPLQINTSDSSIISSFGGAGAYALIYAGANAPDYQATDGGAVLNLGTRGGSPYKSLYARGGAYFGISGGLVAIGTTSPYSGAKLQIKTATNINLAVQTGTTDTTGVKINSFNDAADTNVPMELNGSTLYLKTNETERMRITSGGNIGIGTTSPPSYQNYRYLQITGGATNQGGVLYLTTSDSSYIGEIAVNSNGLVLSGATSNANVLLYAGGNERMRIATGGTVGIGTTNPYGGISGTETALHIYDSNVAVLALQSVSGKKHQIYASNDGGLYFRDDTAAAQRFNIQSNGNIGIGTVSPGYKLDVYTAGNTSAIRINSDSGQNSQIRLEESSSVKFAITYVPGDASVRMYSAGSGSDLLNFKGSGVGIGTTNPNGYKLWVQGDIAMTGNNFYQNGTTTICIAGSISGNQAASWTINCSSQSSLRITAVMNHYGYINSYGCARMSLVANGPVYTEVNISDTTSANGGSWSFTQIDSTRISVNKNAGSYGGGGYYFIEIVGNNPWY